MNKTTFFFLEIVICLFLSQSCKNQEFSMLEKDFKTLNIDNLEERTIYFGHQSVGKNILDGIEENQLNILINDDAKVTNPKGIIHSYIGENTNPFSKLEDFSKFVQENNSKIDTSLMKFCYVDFEENTDIESLFRKYSETYAYLEKLFPHITFAHITVPLVEQQKGIKALVKRILGRSVYGVEDNIVRHQFNELIRSKYQNVFDLAAIESTKPDGSKMEHKLNEQTYYSLYPGYTDDGGHLNLLGRKIASYELVNFLSNIK